MTRAILTVFELNFGLGRAFDSNGKAAMASLPGPNIEVRGLSLDATLKSGSSGMNPMSATVLQRSNLYLVNR
jgi:hypothetical protein